MAGKMITLFKKWLGLSKKSHIRFYTLEPGVHDLYPIIKSTGVRRPFEDEEQTNPEALSSKNCPGIRKLVSTGWIVTAPADFIIKTSGNGVDFEWAEPIKFSKGSPNTANYIASHTMSQVDPLLDNPNNTLRTVVKVETPWRLDASDDLIFLQIPISYNKESRFTAAHGFLDPKYMHAINVQLFWHVLEGETLVRAGTPLCQIIPIEKSTLSMSKFNVEIVKATEHDYERERSFNFAANCTILKHDSLKSRLTRTSQVLNKYKTKE